MQKIKTKNWLIYYCFGLFIFLKLVGTSAFVGQNELLGRVLKLITLLVVLALVVLAIKEIKLADQDYSMLLVSVVVLAGSFLVSYSLPKLSLPLLFLFLVPVIGFPRILYIDLVARLSATSLLTLGLGQFANHNVYNPVTHMYKYSLGFGNPNTAGATILFMLMELTLLHHFYPHKSYYLLYIIFIPLLFLTHSRTAIWSSVIFAILWLVFSKINLQKLRVLRLIVILFPFIMLFVSLGFTLWYFDNANNAFVRAFDLFTSNRLKLSAYFLQRNPGIDLFGKNIFTHDLPLDMGYISLLLQSGWIPTFFVLSLYSLTIRKFITFNRVQYVPILLTVLIANVPEGLLFNITINPFWYCLGILFSQFENLRQVPDFYPFLLRLSWGEERIAVMSQKSKTASVRKPCSKLIIAWGIILLLTNLPLPFNVNNYVLAHNLQAPKVKKLKSTFTKDSTYRYGKPEGIVIHETADKNVSARQEAESFLNTWKKREAYVHAFVDSNEIIQLHTPSRTVWGAGQPANSRYIQVELCEENSQFDFAKSINNDATYVAMLLHQYHLKPVLEDGHQSGTIWSHADVSRYLGGTDHTDPVGYFMWHNYSMRQFFNLVKIKYYHEKPRINYLFAWQPIIQNLVYFGSVILMMLWLIWFWLMQ